jgi:hypothetical protein
MAEYAAHAAMIVKPVVLNLDEAIHSAFRSTFQKQTRKGSLWAAAPTRSGSSTLAATFTDLKNKGFSPCSPIEPGWQAISEMAPN